MSDRSVVVANAGSGKTYLLANRIVRWMLEERRRSAVESPDRASASPDRILAVTFTRKAAGEIVARVLSHLALGASSADKRAEFADPAQVGDFGAGEYAAVLEEFVQSLHRVSISTIDGLFVQLAGAFGPELGLPGEWRIGDDDELAQQRNEAIGEVIAADDARATELARRIGDGRPKVEVQSGIDGAIGSALEIWQRCSLGADPAAPWAAACAEGVELFPGAAFMTDGRIEESLAALRKASLPTTNKGTVRKHWANARDRIVRTIEQRDWFGLLRDSALCKLVQGEDFDGAQAPDDFWEAVSGPLGHARATLQQVLRGRVAATAAMASLVDAQLRESRRLQGVLGFGDLSNALARAHALGDGRLAEMRERLDRSVRDLALDEFQDTAPAQWSVMEPLVDEIAATAGRRLLVVGDPKQSIYGWRGGTPALLESVRRREGLDADVTLDTSWRSSPVVLRFVDELFTSLPGAIDRRPLDTAPAAAREAFRAAGLPASDAMLRSPFARALAAWPYVRHEAAPGKRGMPGLVQAFRALDGDRDSLADAVATVVAARVAARPGASIAVLVGSNAEVSACVASLRAAGIEAADEGRARLSDSAAVATVLALLRLAAAPDDRISHYVVSREPAAGLLGIEPMERHGGGRALADAARALGGRVRADLLERGLPRWVEHVAGLLRPACSRHDLERLRQLGAMAQAADEGMSLHPAGFVRAVEGRSARAADTARVRVMTVHASKGLEFDEVVLASLGDAMGEITGGAGEWAVLSPDPVQPPIAVAPVVAKEFAAHSPLLRGFRAESQVTRLGDDVSVLYVALTRAREAVHLVCPPPPSDDAPRLTATWCMRVAIDGFEQAYLAGGGPGSAFWTYAPGGIGAAALPAKPLPAAAVRPAPEVPAVERVARSSGVRAPSTHAAEEGSFFARGFSGRDDGERGSVAHAWLERIPWADSGSAALDSIDGGEVLRAVGVEIGRPVDPGVAAEMRAAVAQALDGPVGSVLRASRCASWDCERIEVRAEMPFAVAADDVLVRGRMDRVVLGFRGGRVARAEVVDWKTGARDVQGAAFEARIAGYRSQMDDYRRALCAMFGLGAGEVTAALAFVERGEVLEIAGPLAPRHE